MLAITTTKMKHHKQSICQVNITTFGIPYSNLLKTVNNNQPSESLAKNTLYSTQTLKLEPNAQMTETL
jgi:hypothetical protein